MKDNNYIVTARMAADYVKDDMMDLDHEEVWTLFLTTQNKLIAKEMLSKGTLNQTSIDNRTIIKKALLYNAAGIILFHNHPSKETKPSIADIHFTEKLHDACELMQVNLVDHIIIGGDSFYSFSEERTYCNI